MKIAMVLRHYSRYGSSRYALETSKYFAQKGHEVHIFTNKWSNKIKGINFHKIPVFGSNFFLRELSFNLLATLTLKKYNFDVTYSQPGRYFSPKVAGVHICHKTPINQVLLRTPIQKFANKLLTLIETYNLKRARKVIAVSNKVKMELIKYYGVPEEKISVIYDGVNLEEFNPKSKTAYSEKVRKIYNISTKEPVLLFAGVPFEIKGLKYLIIALAYTSYTKLIVIGRQNPLLYIKIASKLGVEDRVIFIPFTKKMPHYFAASDIFVLPTLYDAFGLVILEAMASGLPVVVSKLAGAAELIEDGKEGLLIQDPKNPKEIAEKINYLLDNPKVMRRMGRAARKKAEKYPWSRTANEMLKIFEEVVKR